MTSKTLLRQFSFPLVLVWLLAGLGCLSSASAGPSAANSLFPFDIPQNGSGAGNATDMSFLNALPAGAGGRIVVKGSHFVEEKTGKRVRFLGLNSMFMFPDHAGSDAIAAHYAKMCINLVRLHMVDGNGSQIWKKPMGTDPQFDPDGLDRLDYYIFQLKQHGIYVDLNLHAGRSFRISDGMPPSVETLPKPFEKHLARIDERMIELQEKFARDYLSHVNAYTRLSYAKDPVVAIVEIDNEDSTLSGMPVGDGNYYFNLPEPFRSEVRGKWNDWLKKRYSSDEALSSAWFSGARLPSPSPFASLTKTPTWHLEDHLGVAKLAAGEPASDGAIPPFHFECPVKPDMLYKEQVHIEDLNLVDGGLYTLSFRARADKPRPLRAGVSLEIPDWHSAGLSRRCDLTTDWQTFVMRFVASATVANRVRLSFGPGDDTGAVDVADVRLEPATIESVIARGASLATSSIDIPTLNLPAITADWTQFLSDLDIAYTKRMRALIKGEIGCEANVVDTQVSYGGVAGLRRELFSDFIDHHSYWDHPSATGGKSLGRENWTQRNKPVVDDLGRDDQAYLGWSAIERVAGRPFTVSEYNHPAPSDFQVEGVPLYMSFAALQDWDGVFWFADKATINPWFDCGGNPAKETFFPAAAAIFREGAIAPAANEAIVTLPSASLANVASTMELARAAKLSLPNLLTTRLGRSVDEKASAISISSPVPSSSNGDQTVRVVKFPSGPVYVATSSRALVMTGFVGGQTGTSGPVTLSFPAFGDNFASLTIIGRDGKALSESRSLLVTIAGRTEKAGQIWNEAHNSVGKDWGSGPALAEGIPATVTLANANVKHVWALDPTGARAKAVPVTVSGGQTTFTIGPEYRTVWYELGE
ncbi:MAG: hypothetical protein P4L33_18775 [Capsulimonadaceae bacterium]|nr:hypothetical protein [Capsulimonadaceae bacterium]